MPAHLSSYNFACDSITYIIKHFGKFNPKLSYSYADFYNQPKLTDGRPLKYTYCIYYNTPLRCNPYTVILNLVHNKNDMNFTLLEILLDTIISLPQNDKFLI